jgi:N-acetylneuraminic acid mutarotase
MSRIVQNSLGCLVAALLMAPATQAAEPVQITELPPLEKPVTSFGAAVADGWLYVAGGHLGSPHEYTGDLQSRQLVRLNLKKPEKWEAVGQIPPRTGLAMVGYQGKLYRVGGWEARKVADKWQLFSTRDFARFDPQDGKWEDLAPLPHGRSSHDVALLGSQLYVIGGWELGHESGGQWHETAYVCDLAEARPQWKEIARPPFNRRALAVAGYAGKVYVIGGMDDSNEVTTAVDIFDPQSNAWSKGPAIPGQGFDGFGSSAMGTPAGLFVTTTSGGLYRASADGKSWEEVGKLKYPRNFHRLLAVGDNQLLAVGGTGRGAKVPQVELLTVQPAAVAK